jgi:hypothetical protein
LPDSELSASLPVDVPVVEPVDEVPEAAAFAAAVAFCVGEFCCEATEARLMGQIPSSRDV